MVKTVRLGLYPFNFDIISSKKPRYNILKEDIVSEYDPSLVKRPLHAVMKNFNVPWKVRGDHRGMVGYTRVDR